MVHAAIDDFCELAEVDPISEQEIEDAVLDTLTADLAQGRITADQLSWSCLDELLVRSFVKGA